MKTEIVYNTNKGYFVELERNIQIEGKFRDCYTVFRPWGSVAINDSSYPHDDHGLMLARTRCQYLAHKN